MDTIHLWDNSWHVSGLDDSRIEELRNRDTYHRTPRCLNYYGVRGIAKKEVKAKDLLAFSNTTIGELMEAEGCEVFVWPNSFNEGYDELKSQSIFQVTEKEGKTFVATGNVVGFIGKGDTHIRIHSRFASSEKDDYFLYYMLEKTISINQFNWDTSSSKDGPQVFDFLLFFFPKLLKEAMSQGLYKKYVYHEYNDANIRGVVDVNRHIRHNIPANGKIAYRTREFSYDNPVTQLIRHTIEFIRRKQFGKAVLHNDPDTEGCVQQIIQATPTFQPQQRQAVINENLRPVAHPYYTKYAALQNLCLRILRYEKLSYGEKNTNKIHGILIDAAWLWEEYVAKVLAENGSGLKHYTQKNSPYHLFTKKDNSSFQKIIPDYLDDSYSKDVIVADAKYIPLLKDELTAAKAEPIYYKTIMYMYRFDAKKGFLFHPVSKKKDKETGEIVAISEEKIVENDYTIEGRKDCHLYKVGLVVSDDFNKDSENKNNNNNTNTWLSYRETMKNREEYFVAELRKKSSYPL